MARKAAAKPDENQTSDEPSDAPDRQRLGQAVVIVHGMGEQRPMETIRSFVQTVWSEDTGLTEPEKIGKRRLDPDTGKPINKSWITPDPSTRSHELRRITTPRDVNGRSTDFYELYWSDITQGTTLERLRAWVLGLLLRKWSDVPADVKKAYIAIWILSLLIVLPAAIAGILKLAGWSGFLCLSAGAWAAVAAIMALFVSSILLPYLGDVAIYVQAFPGTVVKRRETRERGLELLEELMRDARYDRIVLVAHSLGTILAYDLLQILWTKYAPSRVNPRQEPDLMAALRAVGKRALPMDSTERAGIEWSDAELDEFRRLQWQAYMVLRDPPAGMLAWKISDFVTFGSPLTHAEFLMARNKGQFDRSVEERLFSTCPPVSEWKEPTILFPQQGAPRYPHHASVFAATRWTNIHDKGNGWLTGDPVSGPMKENFGPGVENVRVRLNWRFGRVFTHTSYWSADADGHEVKADGAKGRPHLQVLRDAVDLRRTLEPSA